MKNRFEERLNGKIIEDEVFGKVTRPEEFRELNYIKFIKGIELVKTIQEGDPKDPNPFFAHKVFVGIEEMLGIEEKDALSFYTAVNSPLDFIHGVDAFFEIDFETMWGKEMTSSEKIGRITIDLTTNPHKRESDHANIVFRVPATGMNESEMIEYAKRLAEEISGKFKSSYSRQFYPHK